MLYNKKDICKVKSDKYCERCSKSLKGHSAISVYDGYESSRYFCLKCEKVFENNNIDCIEAALKFIQGETENE